MIRFLLFFIILLFVIVYHNLVFFVLSHFFSLIKYGIVDLYLYFKHREYNRCHEFGKIRLNSAKSSQVFGNGKTLTLVKQAISIYNQYNDKLVWSIEEQKLVKQQIHIISNVELYGVPYIKWTDTSQFVKLPEMGFGSEDVTIFLLDESGAIFNSRDFRTNITSDFLTRLLQSRKNKMCLYMTSQRFAFTDKILRQTCSTVTTCRKWWRIVEVCEYDAYSVENAGNPSLVKPLSTKFYLATDQDYHSYNSQFLFL